MNIVNFQPLIIQFLLVIFYEDFFPLMFYFNLWNLALLLLLK